MPRFFGREDLDNILAACTVKPMVNQVLAHISNTPHELIGFAQEQGILIEAYSAIAISPTCSFFSN
jgi:diketogulonate reductase-like aldo/keto reductase